MDIFEYDELDNLLHITPDKILFDIFKLFTIQHHDRISNFVIEKFNKVHQELKSELCGFSNKEVNV
jgi:hypothetical protein